MSLNIISLSGLILALGMMIDSSIIVTENISQYLENGSGNTTHKDQWYKHRNCSQLG